MFFFPARTLADCCLGEHNSFAIRVLQQISQNPGKNYNPCLLYGEPATGKTFLLHQFKQWAKQQKFESQWIEPENFQRDYVDSLRTRKLIHFHKRYQDGIFIMDNLQKLSGRKTLEQFRFLFDDLLFSKTQMIFASACHPKQLQYFPEALRTRLNSGMLIPLKNPDLENRILFITRQCEVTSIPTKSEVVRWLAENLECSFLSILKELERLYRIDP
ncbi:MAG: DnaA/Hda family protein, partial [Planctomycetota bacterium]